MTLSSLDVQLERTHRWNCLALIILFLQILRSTEAKVFATQMSPNIVETQYGKIRGILVTLPNRNLPSVEVYMGLQYASLLGGELRFMPPTSSMEKWESTRVAIRFRPVCPQKLWHMEQAFSRMSIGRVEHFKRILPFLEKQSEECLNLNLYVPVKGGKALHTNHSIYAALYTTSFTRRPNYVTSSVHVAMCIIVIGNLHSAFSREALDLYT